MASLNNPYYGAHFKPAPGTAEAVLPLPNNSGEMNATSHSSDMDNLMLSESEKELLPTRSKHRLGNIFKRVLENRKFPIANWRSIIIIMFRSTKEFDKQQ